MADENKRDDEAGEEGTSSEQAPEVNLSLFRLSEELRCIDV